MREIVSTLKRNTNPFIKNIATRIIRLFWFRVKKINDRVRHGENGAIVLLYKTFKPWMIEYN